MPGIAILLLLMSSANAEPLEFNSGHHRVAMIELFTSEGCNTCPPADRWLSSLEHHSGLWTSFVPVAFHVDYWDYIGWQDRFARAEFGHRQQRYASEGNSRFVYTPGMFRNGLEWQGWRRNALVDAGSELVGNLHLGVDGDTARLQFDPAAEHDRVRAHVAILGMNLETRVHAGENDGKTLHHDFVVLELRSIPMHMAGGALTATVRLAVVSPETSELAIVAWVSRGGSPTPLQAVGGYLPAETVEQLQKPDHASAALLPDQ